MFILRTKDDTIKPINIDFLNLNKIFKILTYNTFINKNVVFGQNWPLSHRLTWDNGKKPSFGPDFGPFDSNLGPNTFCVDLLDVIHCASYNCIQFKRKLMDKTCENGQKPSFGPKFVSQIFFVDFNFTTC